MRLFAILYFLVLGYCIRAFGWDKDLVRVAGNVLDQVAARWAIASDDARNDELGSRARQALGMNDGT